MGLINKFPQIGECPKLSVDAVVVPWTLWRIDRVHDSYWKDRHQVNDIDSQRLDAIEASGDRLEIT